MSKISRSTIVEALPILETLTHADIDRWLLKYGLEDVAPNEGIATSKANRVNALIRYFIYNPDKKGPNGSNLSFEVVEDLIDVWNTKNSTYYYIEKELPKLINSLERDGYTIADGKLMAKLPQVINLPERNDELKLLLEKFGFIIEKGHLEQALSAHTRGEWASANAQLRTFLESLFDSISERLICTGQTLPEKGYPRCQFLSQLSPPFFYSELNEWDPNGNGFVQGIRRRLHPKGSHPGLSDEQDSTYRLQIVTLTALYYLKRLEKRV